MPTKFERNRLFVPNDPFAPTLCPELAREIGLNESILLLQLGFWIAIANHQRDGRRWTYQSTRDIQERFPFWSVATVNRIIHSLEEKELIIVGNYNKHAYDKTRWFALNLDSLRKLRSIHVVEEVVSQNETGLSQNETPLYQNETGSAQNETTIPETTTDISTENSKKKASPKNQKEIASILRYLQAVVDKNTWGVYVQRCVFQLDGDRLLVTSTDERCVDMVVGRLRKPLERAARTVLGREVQVKGG